jgi:hypothetical protein
MNQRELDREARREQKEANERYEALCSKTDAEQKRQGEEFRERERRIKWANENPDLCLMLSELASDVWATTVHEEVESAITFAVLLGVEVIPTQTVYDFLTDVFVAWNKLGRPLLNPLSRRFSPHTIKVRMEKRSPDGPLRPSASAARKEFKRTFVCLEPITDYFRPLADHIEAPALIAPVAVEPVVVAPNAPQFARCESSDKVAPFFLQVRSCRTPVTSSPRFTV